MIGRTIRTTPSTATPPDGIVRERRWYFAIPVTLWLIGGFLLANIVVVILLFLLDKVGISEKTVDQDLYVTAGQTAAYALLLLIILGAPRLFKLWSARIPYRRLLGLTRLLRWRDLLYAVIGFIVVLALRYVFFIIASLIPAFNAKQAQDLGLSSVLGPQNAVIVFILLVVIAPFCEEVIFRGYLFGTLRRSIPLWAAILLTSVLFGVAHLQWNVGINVFAMSLVSCFLRYRTGSLWASIVVHMINNALAFYALYIATNGFF